MWLYGCCVTVAGRKHTWAARVYCPTCRRLQLPTELQAQLSVLVGQVATTLSFYQIPVPFSYDFGSRAGKACGI